MELARRLGCNDRDVMAIGRGAWLHDIGKMAIPDEILLKQGPLTDEEWSIMKTHTSLGREFVDGLSFLGDAATIPYSHHEHWDGSGYPDGLRGERIPLAARIFAVVDSWDALRSDRPYRKAWSRAEAIVHLRGNAGALFDPRVVESFLALVGADDAEAGQPYAQERPAVETPGAPPGAAGGAASAAPPPAADRRRGTGGDEEFTAARQRGCGPTSSNAPRPHTAHGPRRR